MEYIWTVVIVLLTYLVYKLIIRPIQIKAYYSKIFKANGYKVFQMPFQPFSAPFIGDWMQKQKTKKDFNYSGKHIYSDSYDLLVSNVFNKPQLVFFNDKLMKGFLDKDVQMKISKMMVGFAYLQALTKRTVTFLQKDNWKHRRALLAKVFNFDFINSQIPTMIHAANVSFQRFQQEFWVSHPQKKPQKQISLNLYDLITKYTSSVMMAGFLGLGSMKQQLKGKTIQQEILKMTDESIKISRDLLVLMLGPKLIKLGLRKVDRQLSAWNEQIRQILRSYITQYRKKFEEKTNAKPNTIIELILQEIKKQKQANIQKEEITDDDLIDQIKSFVISGTDTTSNYLTMLLLSIYQHKEVLQRLRNEIQKHIKSDEDITPQNIKKIGYLDLVMQEGSRVNGASQTGFQRILQQDTAICGIPIKKGTCLNLYWRPLLFNPKTFKDPLAFKPQRWQPQTQETKKLQQLLSYQFFGGPRSCLGKQLALTETKVGIIKFLRRYGSLTEPGIKDRVFVFQLTAHVQNTEVILQKSE